MSWTDQLRGKEDFPEDYRQHFDLLCETVLRGALKEQLVLEWLIDAFVSGHNGQLSQKEIAVKLNPEGSRTPKEMEKSTGSVRQIVGKLRSKLHGRSPGPRDPVRIKLMDRPRGYFLIEERPQSDPQPVVENDRSILDMLEARREDGVGKKFYAYHLTLGPDRKPRWYCKEAEFEHSSTGGGLVANVVILPRTGMTAEAGRNEDRYLYEASAPVNKAQLIFSVRHVKSAVDKVIATEVFPRVATYVKFPWCGLVIANQTFLNNPASSIAILHNEQFDLKTATKSRVGNGEPITTPETVEELNEIWHRRASEADLDIVRLPNGAFSDHPA